MNGKLVMVDDQHADAKLVARIDPTVDLGNLITDAKVGDEIHIGDDITIVVMPKGPIGTSRGGRYARLGIDAPSSCKIDRGERLLDG